MSVALIYKFTESNVVLGFYKFTESRIVFELMKVKLIEL